MQISARNAQDAIARLAEDEVLFQMGGGARNRIYEAPEVLSALDGFAARANRSRGQ